MRKKRGGGGGGGEEGASVSLKEIKRDSMLY